MKPNSLVKKAVDRQHRGLFGRQLVTKNVNPRVGVTGWAIDVR